ncbi:hypothetical protein [Flavobacterium hydatis]|uniref:Uncharacterized protein n=1 Tax=Flavobacterium hydatis TaxID=991 RepID=A0ABX4CIF8_FLAHY|nr:hypothetical protein [Flavobacterium hydatis]OXA95074.1 hypothetical protein B0A62_09205 [Flavobacterium hydatis]
MLKNLARLGHPVFLISLIILILNDWVFKNVFHNYVTGKLSDFAGLFVFPFFWSVLFFKRAKEIHLGTILFFIFWKSPFSEVFVNLFGLYRIVDFSDNMALLSVFVSYQLLKKESVSLKLRPITLQLIFLLSCFSFIATTQRPSYEEYSIENEFLNLYLKNETDKKLVILIDFKYSKNEEEIYKKRQIALAIDDFKKIWAGNLRDGKAFVFTSSDSIWLAKGISENWAFREKTSNIDPLVLDVKATQSIKLPLYYKDSLIGFPESFKISVLDSNWKTIKIYTKKIFFDKINIDQDRKINEFSRPESLSLTFGEKKEPLIVSNCYGKWESNKRGDLNKIEINSRYCVNDTNGDVYECRYINDSILVYTPNKIYIGVIKKVTTNELVICWDGKTILTYKKSSKLPILG